MKKKDWIRKPLMLLLAGGISLALVFSIPFLNFLRDGGAGKKERIKTEVAVVRHEKKEEQKAVQREVRRPERKQIRSRTLKSGPRFAMDLGVAGIGGVAVPSDLVAKSSGGGRAASTGDVDQRPQAQATPDLELPQAIRDREQDAFVLVSFCVDASGRAHDFRVSEERPAGVGLADAARAALSRVRFEPAKKGGRSVPFCGMEQPFEVIFTP